MKKLAISTSALLMAMVGISACTKTLPYQSMLKEEVYSKSSVDTKGEYLYVPSTGAVSRSATNIQPFMAGDAKKIKFVFTETALQAWEQEADKNFTANPENQKLVFEIPITHIDFHCATDRYNNCKNTEEEDKSITWQQKGQFKPDFSKVTVAEVTTLPNEIMKVLGKDSCMTESSNRVLNWEFADDHINFQIERTLTSDLHCAAGARSLSDLTTTVVSNYSLVKMSAVATPGYQAVNYPLEDENTFGFFKTAFDQTDVDDVQRTNGEVRMMNRWNPARSEVVYYLSDEFNKPENQSLKKAAYEAFNKLNNGLKSAGAQFRLTLKDPAGLNPGDLRNSMIVLVEDPVGGLLGYGPTIANPDTGEIISGHVAMFSGTMKSSARVSYEEIRNLKMAQKIAKTTPPPAQEIAPKGLNAMAPLLIRPNPHLAKSLQKLRGIVGASPTSNSTVSKLVGSATGRDIKALSNPANNKNMKSNSLDVLLANHHTCMYPSGMTEANTKVVNALVRQFSNDMKPWEDLSTEEKQAALDIIMPELFEPILVHEMGHNLGLRHNFSGSEDAANFYSKAELSAFGIDYAVPYSSVMDYGATDLNVLPTLGKYDVAALNFAYGRQLKKSDGSVLNLKSTDTISALKAAGMKLAPYRFCTDESADINAGCKRFDEGTTNVAIVDSIIARYWESVRLSGSRRGREIFSMMDDTTYAKHIGAIFYDLRTFMEVVERIKYAAGVTDDSKEWTDTTLNDADHIFLRDLHDAAVKAGNFLISVLTMPETTCLVGDLSKPTEAPQPVRLADVDSHALDCSGIKAKPGFALVGQVGRPFLDKKDPNSKNPYVDQIDVRGMWMDKVLAAKFLFTRKLQENPDVEEGSFDENSDSFFNLPQLRDSLQSTLAEIMTDNLETDMDVTLADGSSVKVKIPSDVAHGYVIPKNLDENIAKYLGIPNRDTHLVEILGQRIASQNEQSLNRDPLARHLLLTVGVYKTPSIFGFGSADQSLKQSTLNGQNYAGGEDNVVAQTYFEQVETSQIIQGLYAEGKDGKGLKELLLKLIRLRQPPLTLIMPKGIPAPDPIPVTLPADLTPLDRKLVDTKNFTNEQFSGLIQTILAGGNPAEQISNVQRFVEMLPVLN